MSSGAAEVGSQGAHAKLASLKDFELIDFPAVRRPCLIGDVKDSYLSALISVLGKRVNTSWTVVTLSDQN